MSISNPTDATGDFKKIVDESKQKIHEAEQLKIKGSRGRKPLPRDSEGNIIRESAQATPVQSSPQSSAVDLSALLIEPIQLISRMPAKKHKIAELEFDFEESKALAASLDKVFNAYFPDLEKISPKAAAWLGLGMVAVSLSISKMSIYSEVMQSREKSKNVSKEISRDAASDSIQKDNDYFKRKDPFAQI